MQKLLFPKKFSKLEPDLQLRLATACMANNHCGYEFERKFKEPARLARYFIRIEADPNRLVDNYQLYGTLQDLFEKQTKEEKE